MDIIQIYFIPSDDFAENLIKQILEDKKEFSFTEDKKNANIYLKIDGDICHLYAQECYDFIKFPTKADILVQKIKMFFHHNGQSTSHISYQDFMLTHDKLIYHADNIGLSASEHKLLSFVLNGQKNGASKKILNQEFSGSLESLIYRLRRKLSQYDIDLLLKNEHYFLIKHILHKG
jgi:hypothetical protein